jgi:hypothetical protein
MDVRSCAERHGGRQALKDKIKRLQPASDDEQVAEVMAALYEVYKVVSLSICLRDHLWSYTGMTADGVVA